MSQSRMRENCTSGLMREGRVKSVLYLLLYYSTQRLGLTPPGAIVIWKIIIPFPDNVSRFWWLPYIS